MITALGVDPGLTTGLCLARWETGKRKAVTVRAFQADYGSAAILLGMLLCGGTVNAAQVEAYDSRRRGAMTSGWTARQAHDLIAELENVLARYGVKAQVRQVASVKTWACCGDRMRKAGLDVIPGKMTDATSAGWHCLYTACKDLGMPDPASTRRREPDEPGIRAGTG